MATLKKLMVSLGLDASDYHRGLDDAKKKTESSASAIGQKLQSIGGKMQEVGGKMSVAVTAPIVGGFTVAMNAASDMNETVSKVGVVFGDQADEVMAFGANASTALGMSSEQALAAAGTYGNLFVSMGMTTEASAGMSTGLVQLASDLGSFNNMSPDEVLEKLRAGLTGETEPLKSLGVNLNAAAVEAKAMEMGLVGVDEELTASAKAQATYALIMEQTKTAQGDFARTSDGLANSTKIAKAQLADTAATMGQHLLPIGLKITQFVSDLLTKFNDLSPGTQKVILAVLAVAAAIGPLLVAAGTLVSSIGAIIPVATSVAGVLSGPVLIVIGAVIAGIALLAAAWTNDWGGIRTTITTWWEQTGKPIFEKLVAWLQENIPKAIETLTKFWNETLLPVLRAVWKFLSEDMKPIWEALANLFENVLKKAIEALVGFWDNILKPALQAMWKILNEDILPVVKSVATWIADHLGPAFSALSGIISRVAGWITTLATKIGNLKLPWWLTPGSPTPFETGLVGVMSALRSLSRAGLPEFSAGLRLMPTSIPGDLTASVSLQPLAPAFAAATAGGGSGPTVVLQYSPMMSFADEYEVQQRILPFVEDGVRTYMARQ